MSPALEGGFLTTKQPGNSPRYILIMTASSHLAKFNAISDWGNAIKDRKKILFFSSYLALLTNFSTFPLRIQKLYLVFVCYFQWWLPRWVPHRDPFEISRHNVRASLNSNEFSVPFFPSFRVMPKYFCTTGCHSWDSLKGVLHRGILWKDFIHYISTLGIKVFALKWVQQDCTK